MNEIKPTYNNNILVSIVIPAFNAENSILKSLQSLYEQSYKNLEIIVVLDGCTDNTLEVCQKQQVYDNRIKIITQENTGPYKARYKGIDNSTGKYVMFLDADDYLDNDAVKTLVETAEKNNSDLVRFRYENLNNGEHQCLQCGYFKDTPELTINKNNFKESVYPFFLDGYMLNAVWLNFVQRICIPKDNLHQRIGFGEDLLFNLALTNNLENITFIDNPLYKYCTTEGSITKTKDVNKLLNNLSDCLYVYLKLYDYAVDWEMPNEQLEKLKIRIVYELSTIIKRIHQGNKNENSRILKVLNNEKYNKLKNSIDKSKLNPKHANYDLIIDLIDNKIKEPDFTR